MKMKCFEMPNAAYTNRWAQYERTPKNQSNFVDLKKTILNV